MCRVVADQSPMNLSLGLSKLPRLPRSEVRPNHFCRPRDCPLLTEAAEAVSNWFGSETAITDPFFSPSLRAIKHLIPSFQSFQSFQLFLTLLTFVS